MTLVVPDDLEILLDGMKKDMFYNCSWSEMIRTLITEGLDTMNSGKKT